MASDRSNTERFRGPLYLFADGECSVFFCMDDGEIRTHGGDDVPEEFCGDLEGFARFDGTVHSSQNWTPEQCDENGIPHHAADYSEWWQGKMVPATLEEVASVFSIPAPAVGAPGDSLEEPAAESCAQCAAVDAACLAVCPENSTRCVDSPDPDLGRYVLCNEDGGEIIDTNSPAEVVTRLAELWDFSAVRAALVSVNTPMPPEFLAYVTTNYPPRTVISDPAYHAPKIWRAALHALRSWGTA